MSSVKRASMVPQVEGTQPEEMAHVSSFVLVMKGTQVLLAWRSKPERAANTWNLPSAVINWGEDPGHAALRIVREQIGVAPSAMKLLDVQSFGDKHWDICFLFQCEVPAVGKLQDGIDKTGWFDLGKLPPELREGHREVIDYAKSRKVV